MVLCPPPAAAAAEEGADGCVGGAALGRADVAVTVLVAVTVTGAGADDEVPPQAPSARHPAVTVKVRIALRSVRGLNIPNPPSRRGSQQRVVAEMHPVGMLLQGRRCCVPCLTGTTDRYGKR